MALGLGLGLQFRRNVGSRSFIDQFGQPAAAYSLRDLSGSNPNVIRVRRSSDNAEQDFKSGEITDGTLTTFTGANDGFVTTWYDQAGSNDATQGTAAKQPKIVDAGVLVEENGKPALDFDGTNDYLFNASSLSYSGGVSWYSVQNLDSVDSSERIWSDDIIGIQGYAQFFSGSPHKINDNGTGLIDFAFTSLTANTRQLYSFNFDDSSGVYNYALDGLNTSATISGWTGPIGPGGSANIGIMSAGNGGQYGDGRLQELIIYPNDQSSNRKNIEANINDYYSIY